MTVPRAKPSKADDQLAALLGALANLNGIVGQLHVGIRTLNGAQRVGAEAKPVNGASQRFSASAGRLAGWSLYNPAATALRVRVRDGADVDGQIMGSFSIPATSEHNRQWLPQGIGFVNGLFLEFVSGVDLANLVEGAVYVLPAAPIT